MPAVGVPGADWSYAGGDRHAPAAFGRVEQLSRRIWYVVEDDRLGRKPHLYIVAGAELVVLVDSGAGSSAQRRRAENDAGCAASFGRTSPTPRISSKPAFVSPSSNDGTMEDKARRRRKDPPLDAGTATGSTASCSRRCPRPRRCRVARRAVRVGKKGRRATAPPRKRRAAARPRRREKEGAARAAAGDVRPQASA